MSKAVMPWYKRCPNDWRSGVRGMSMELRGFYSECLDAMWERQGQLPKDEKWLALAFQCSARLVRSLMPKLIALGKIVETDKGYYNQRMMADVLGVDDLPDDPEWAATQAPVVGESSTTRAPVEHDSPTTRARLTDDSPTNSEKNPTISTRDLEPESEPEREPPTPLRGPTPLDALTAFEAWNATAQRCGIPQAAKLTPDRQRRIIARLKDYGHDGWAQALANIERSSFLTGKNDRNWAATLDFLVRAEAFGKVHDGTYGNGRHAQSAGVAPVPLKPHEIELDREAAELRRAGVI